MIYKTITGKVRLRLDQFHTTSSSKTCGSKIRLPNAEWQLYIDHGFSIQRGGSNFLKFFNNKKYALPNCILQLIESYLKA